MWNHWGYLASFSVFVCFDTRSIFSPSVCGEADSRVPIIYHTNTCVFKVGLQVKIGKMSSTDLYWVIMRLYPSSCFWYHHFCPMSSTIAWVDPSDNLINPKQQKQNLTKSNKSAHRDVSTPVLCHWNVFFFCGAGVEGIYCEVHKTKSIVPTKSSVWLVLLYCMWVLKVWS